MPTAPATPAGGFFYAEDSARSAREACILFDAKQDPSVVVCDVAGRDDDGIDLMRVGCFSALLRGKDAAEHVVLGDGLRRLRLDIAGGTVLDGPVHLRFRLEGLRGIEAPLLTLRRLAALDRLGRMPLQLFAPERRAQRWIFALRAFDARQAGASQRDVAQLMFGTERVRGEWDGASDFMRSQVRRLLGFAGRMTQGGWRALLTSQAAS